MERLTVGVLTLARIAVAALAGVFVFNSSPATAQGQGQGSAPVTVVAPLPLPVTLAGDVGGTVAATQSGPWEVGVNGTVLVKNVNEPGREPYEYGIEFTSTSCSFNCFNFASVGSVTLFDGPEVPAGKRLIIKYVAGRLPNTGSADVSVVLQHRQILSQQEVKWAFYGPFFIQSTLPAFSSEAFVTYGPGERPHFNVRLPASNNFFAYVSVSGYLIDATN